MDGLNGLHGLIATRRDVDQDFRDASDFATIPAQCLVDPIAKDQRSRRMTATLCAKVRIVCLSESLAMRSMSKIIQGNGCTYYVKM